MKVCISNIAWSVEEDSRVARLLAGRGVRGVEVAPSRSWPDLAAADAAEVIAYRSFWADHGIEVPALQALLFGRPDLLLFGDRDARSRTLDYLAHAIRVGSLLGARVLVFGSPANRRRGDIPPAGADAIATDFFGRLATLAVDQGVTIGIEANPTAYGCDFLTTNTEVIEFVKRLAHPGLVHHVDLGGTMLAGESPAGVVAAARQVAHVHASEPHLGAPGPSAREHRRLAQALAQARYDRWVSVETRREAGDPVGAVKRAVDFALMVYGPS